MNLTNEESLLSLEKTISSVNGIYIGSENNKNLFYFSNVVTDSRNVVENSLLTKLLKKVQQLFLLIQRNMNLIQINTKN